MRFLRRFFIRLSNFTTGRRADQRLREEMAEHLALQTEENLRAGMSPAEARRQAALKLGAAQAIREHHHAEQSLPLAENLLARSPLCVSHAAPVSRIFPDCHRHHGPRRRSHHRHLQRHRRNPAASFALPPPQRTGAN